MPSLSEIRELFRNPPPKPKCVIVKATNVTLQIGSTTRAFSAMDLSFREFHDDAADAFGYAYTAAKIRMAEMREAEFSRDCITGADLASS